MTFLFMNLVILYNVEIIFYSVLKIVSVLNFILDNYSLISNIFYVIDVFLYLFIWLIKNIQDKY